MLTSLLPLYSLPPPVFNPWQLLICSPISKILSFQKGFLNCIMQYIKCWDWLFSTWWNASKCWSMLLIPSFFWLSSIPRRGCTTVCLTIRSLTESRIVSSIWLLWIKLLWTFADRFLCEHKFLFLWDKCPRGTITGLYGNCMFSYVRNCQTVLQGGCSLLRSYQQRLIDPDQILASIGCCHYFFFF